MVKAGETVFMKEMTVLSVSELTDQIKGRLEGEFSNLRVEGEISNFRPSSTGHYYFSLKDKNAVIQAVMFRGRLGHLTFFPSDGNLVKVRGSLSVYPPRGAYQIICDSMEKSGEGDILALLEARKRRLASEGCFDAARKKPLPSFPRRIAVITSPTGAALQDILKVSRRRNPGIDILILPAPVQGSEAAAILTARLKTAPLFEDVEAVILGRGGGSLEDLLPFSDEDLVRAVADCPLPVVTAVGHEIDTCLADLAASAFASTPSAAAEMLFPARPPLQFKIGEYKRRMHREMINRTASVRLLLGKFTAEDMDRRLRPRLRDQALRIDELRESLNSGIREALRSRRRRVELLAVEMTAASPQAALKRGFALLRDGETGRPVDRLEKTRPGAPLTAELAGGRLLTRVEKVESSMESGEAVKNQ
jgi:exodeoxyribonuclease VII large subunit